MEEAKKASTSEAFNDLGHNSLYLLIKHTAPSELLLGTSLTIFGSGRLLEIGAGS